MTLAENLFENLRLELRRGCLTLAVLVELRQEHYGYTLRKDLAECGLAIDESTLYPLLRRLESTSHHPAASLQHKDDARLEYKSDRSH